MGKRFNILNLFQTGLFTLVFVSLLGFTLLPSLQMVVSTKAETNYTNSEWAESENKKAEEDNTSEYADKWLEHPVRLNTSLQKISSPYFNKFYFLPAAPNAGVVSPPPKYS